LRWSSGPLANVVVMARTLIVFALGVLVGAVLWPADWSTGPTGLEAGLDGVSRSVAQLLRGAADLLTPGSGPGRP